MRAVGLLASVFVFVGGPALAAGLCPKWGQPAIAGRLDAKVVNEASGLDASARYPDRLYHNNDSGDELQFYITDLKGGGTRIVPIKGPKPLDIEELSLGPCGDETCLYLGDIGDNPASRSEVAFTVVREQAVFEGEQTPLRVVRARYPDGPHNAEAFAIHPNGDLFLVTKPGDAQVRDPGPALVYKLSANQLRQSEGAQVFTKVGQIDLPKLLPDLPYYGKIATGLDIAADGRSVLLTYAAILELGFDFAQGVPETLVAGRDYQEIRPRTLAQQEAIAWLPDASGFIYDSEATPSGPTPPLVKVPCGS